MICPDHGPGLSTSEPRPRQGFPKCTPHGEREEKYLLSRRIDFVNQKMLLVARSKRITFDFYLKYSALIEYDGSQHYIERDDGPFKGQFKEIQRKIRLKIFLQKGCYPIAPNSI